MTPIGSSHARLQEGRVSALIERADEWCAKNGCIDLDGIEDLVHRAGSDGSVTRDEASDLNFVRVHYADKLTKDAAFALDHFLSNWISAAIHDQAKRDKEKAREKKAQDQIERIEAHHDYLREWRAEVDQRMRALDIDDKQRVMITQFFNLKHD